MRIRKLNGIDPKELSQKAKKTKGQKIKPVFREVCALSDNETADVESECDESVLEKEKEDNSDHDSDDEERPRKKG